MQPEYFPEPTDGVTQLEDPSDIEKEQIDRLLEHWSRPVPGSDVFRFAVVWSTVREMKQWQNCPKIHLLQCPAIPETTLEIP
jgi:hypothetical protein